MADHVLPCKNCGFTPNRKLHGGGFVSYGCCQMRTAEYNSAKTAREVWNEWASNSNLIPSGTPKGRVDRIGYDVDGVLCNFKKAMLEKARELGYRQEVPDHHMDWDEYDPEWGEDILDEVWDKVGDNHTWWLRMDPYDDARIQTDVHCYITARSVPSELTEQWLIGHGFPKAPVHSVGHKNPKAGTAEKANLDLFVDDKPSNVQALNTGGIPALLRDRPHNWSHDEMDSRRIRCLSQVQRYT